MSDQIVELQIILGFNCNFACKHCLNSSRPNFSTYDISKNEIEHLAQIINNDLRISGVSLNGGEPLLYLEQMKYLKSLVVRPVHWALTSNGSLIDKALNDLEKLGLDSAVLSFDKYHEKFLSPPAFRDILMAIKNVIPKVEVNLVFESLSDLKSLQEICEQTNVSIVPTRLIKSGRAAQFQEGEQLVEESAVCPNLKSEKVKITYIPKRGFTICCGPLVFDHNLENTKFFSKSLDEVFNSLEYRAFNSQFGESQILAHFPRNGGVCNTCVSSIQRLSEVPLPENIIQSLNRKFLFTNHYLNEHFERKLSNDFHVKYLIKLDPKNFRSVGQDSVSSTISVNCLTLLTQEQLKEFKDFTIKSFYIPYSNEYNEKDIEEFVNVMPIYFSGDNETETFFFYKEHKLVGVLTLYRYLVHPFLGQEAYHIGYWGYDKASLTKDEARYIKTTWNKKLKDVAVSRGVPVVGLIDYFNFSVRKMVFNFGFNLQALRLDKRP